MLARRWRICPSSCSFSQPGLCFRDWHGPPSSLPRSDPSSRPVFRRFFSAARAVGAAACDQTGEGGRRKTPLSRRLVHVFLLSLTGGVALSALNDLAIFHGCSRHFLPPMLGLARPRQFATSFREMFGSEASKAIEKASQNQEFVEALGEPIVRGPWYDASLALGHRRQTVSCKFPVSGPRGNAILKIKAVRAGDDTWFSFLRHNDWDILISEALLQNERKQPLGVILIDDIPADAKDKQSTAPESGDDEKK